MHLLKQYLLLTLILFCSVVLYGQMSKLERINSQIGEAKSDSEHIELMDLKIEYYTEVNRDSATNVIAQKIEYSKKAGYRKDELDGYISMISNLAFSGNYDKAKNYIDTAYTLAYTLNDSVYIRKVYSNFGLYYGLQSKYDSSLYYYQRALDIAERMGMKNEMGRDYSNISIGYLMQSKLSEALAYQQKSLALAEELDDLESEANILVNMGCTYQSMGDTTKAEDAFLKAIDIATPGEFKIILTYAYTNISSLYNGKKNWGKSYQTSMKAESLANEIGDLSIRAASLSNAARAQNAMQNYEEAETLAKRSVALADEANQPLVIFQTLKALGDIYTATERFKEAIPVYKNGIEALTRAKIYDEALSHAYKQLSLSLEKTGQYARALENYKFYAQIVDSIRQNENIKKATELSMTYQFDKEKAHNEAEQIKKDAKVKTNQLMLMGGLLLMLILAVGGWLSFRNKHHANNLLKIEKAKVEETLSTLKITQSQLVQSEKMASLGELTAGIAHEIQNPLNFVNNFSELNKELIDELELEEAKSADQRDHELVKELLDGIKLNMEKINHHGQRADGIVKGMLQHSRKNTGENELTDLNKLSDEYLRLAYHGFRAKDKGFNAKMETDFDPKLPSVRVVPQDIGRVFLNLLTNAFYAVNVKNKNSSGDFEPTIHLSTKNYAEHIEISIQDNGMGMQDEVIQKIFQPFFTTKPTGEGTGLGLSMSYDIITKSHGGNLYVESKPGEGTKFTISIPKTL